MGRSVLRPYNGERNPGTDLKVGHYIEKLKRKAERRPPPSWGGQAEDGSYIRGENPRAQS